MGKHVLAAQLRKHDQVIIEGVPLIVRNWPKLKQGFVTVKASADVPNAEMIFFEFSPDEKVLKI